MTFSNKKGSQNSNLENVKTGSTNALLEGFYTLLMQKYDICESKDESNFGSTKQILVF